MLGTRLAGAAGHILDPHGAQRPPRQLSVSAPRAALADALSTALCLVRDAREAGAICAAVPGARLEAFAEIAPPPAG